MKIDNSQLGMLVTSQKSDNFEVRTTQDLIIKDF